MSPSVPFLARLAVAVGGGAGALVAAGWLAGLSVLTSFGPGLPAGRPLGAAAALAVACSLALQLREPVGPARRVAARTLAWLALAIGLTAIAAAPWPTLGVLTEAWLPRPLPGLVLALLAIAALGLDEPERVHLRRSDFAALAAGVIVSVPLAGYVTTIDYMQGLATRLGMPLPLTIAGFALAAVVLLARPGRGVAAALEVDSPAGLIARRLLPAIAVLPVALIGLRLLLAAAGVRDPALEASIAIIALTLVASSLVLWIAFAVDRLELARRSEAAASARLADLVEAANVAVVSTDRVGRITTWNPAAEQLYGAPAAEAIGRPLADFAPPEAADDVRFLHRRALAGGRVVDYDTVRRRRDGTTFAASLTISPLIDAGFAVVGLVETVRDVSEERRLEAELRRQELRLRSVVDAAHDAILFLDARGRITGANPRAESMFGVPRHELVGRPLAELVRGSGGGGGPGGRSKTGELIETDAAGLRPDGGSFPAELTVVEVATTDEAFSVAFVRDVSDRKRAAEALVRRELELEQARELDRLKDHIFSTMSHETRTPLSLIQGYAELLQERLPADEALAGLIDGVTRLSGQLDAILDYGALLSGHMPIYRTQVDPAEVAELVHGRHAERYAAKGVRLTLEAEDDLPGVLADPRRVDQVLAVLVDNSLKFTPAGGETTLRVYARDCRVCFEVSDAGPGIPPATLARLGEPFRQSATGDAERTPGLGLGLAIATRLAALQQGTLVIGPRPGGGTLATFCLPAAAARA